MATVTNYFYNLLDCHPQPNIGFKSSEHYLIKIKEDINFSSRHYHPNRRPNATTNEISMFIKKCRYVMRRKEKPHIVNTDESFFRINEMQNITWAKKNTDNVYVNTDFGDKAGFTFPGTIAFDGSKHSLVLISKEKPL